MDDLILPAGEKVVHLVERQSANLVNDENVELMRKVVEHGANEIVAVSGMDYQEAVAAIIIGLGSHIEDKEVNPGCTIKGSSSTGKTQVKDIILRYCKDGVSISCWELSVAAVRDKILEQIKEPNFKKTIALEEADQLTDDERRLSSLIASSYSKETSRGAVNRGQTGAGKAPARLWEPEDYDLWGVFFIVHRRTLVEDIAKIRRAITLHTYKIVREGGFPKATAVDSPYAKYAGGVNELTLPPVTIPLGIEGSVFDNWKLYLQIARALGLDDFVDWVNNRMVEETRLMQGDRGDEVSNVCFSCLVAALPGRQKSKGDYFSILFSDIRKAALEHYGIAIRVGQMRREFDYLGFKVSTPGGYPSVTPTDKTLEAARIKLGITDVIKFGRVDS